MSELWKRAENAVKSLNGFPDFITDNDVRNLGLRDGEFAIDCYRNGCADCPMQLGMYKQIDIEKNYDAIAAFAKENGLKVENRVLSIVLRSPMGDREGIVTSTYFSASNPELLEEMGKRIHRLKPRKKIVYC
jgi:hypothetical protein